VFTLSESDAYELALAIEQVATRRRWPDRQQKAGRCYLGGGHTDRAHYRGARQSSTAGIPRLWEGKWPPNKAEFRRLFRLRAGQREEWGVAVQRRWLLARPMFLSPAT